LTAWDIWEASQGDLSEAQKLAASGVDIDGADYDGRTASHLAASEEQAHIVEYLIAKGVNLPLRDKTIRDISIRLRVRLMKLG
jgi:glutaminase